MSLKPVLIVEHCSSGLKLNESASSVKKDKFLMEGVFTEFDVKNRNDRVYTASKFIPYLDELLERKKQLGVVYGEFDHPDVFDTSLSRVSHVVENAWFNKEKNRVDGQIVLLDTHWGKEAKAIVKEGYPVFVSSRAAGVTDAQGLVELKKLFTYDCVADPGFSSAKMNLKSINESVGLSQESNYRLYDAPENLISKYSREFDLSDESKTNELFEMNKNDMVTKSQLTEYSNYLVKEINDTKTAMNKIVKTTVAPTVNEDQLNKLADYYEALNEQNTKVVEYLDYLASHVKLVVEENKKLNKQAAENVESTEKLGKKVDKTVEYTNYLAENLDKNISYAEYLAENLDKNISYSEYIAENLDKNISYSEYIAENLDKNISYSEYIAESLDKNISYSEYLAENLDKNISYSEYIAENLNGSIKYSEYLAENLDANVAYSEYLAENLEKGIKYSEYVAECADHTMSYAGMISETLNSNESLLTEGTHIKNPADYLQGKMSSSSEDAPELKVDAKVGALKSDATAKSKSEDGDKSNDGNEKPKEADEAKPSNSDDKHLKGSMDKSKDKYSKGDMDKKAEDKVMTESKTTVEDEVVNESKEKDNTPVKPTGNLTSKIDVLIQEAMKRKVSDDQNPHFYKFLNRSQVKAFESLNVEEQENIKVALNESSYYSATDILKTMREVLNAKQVSPEEKLIKGMPDETQKLWENLDTKTQQSVVAQSKFYVLDTEEQIENFWSTRKLGVKSLNEAKTLIQKDESMFDDGLSQGQVDSFMERFNSLK